MQIRYYGLYIRLWFNAEPYGSGSMRTTAPSMVKAFFQSGALYGPTLDIFQLPSRDSARKPEVALKGHVNMAAYVRHVRTSHTLFRRSRLLAVSIYKKFGQA